MLELLYVIYDLSDLSGYNAPSNNSMDMMLGSDFLIASSFEPKPAWRQFRPTSVSSVSK